ncbi:MAG: C-GCAxxG-C-C family protein, partial [Planctomycetota bacterium]|jgi:hypothetical protein
MHTISRASAKRGGPDQWSWNYTRLDTESVRKKGHLYYYDGRCCAGAFKAIVLSLAQVVGHPFDKIPCDMMRYGAGGVAGFGSICGALNGASAAIGLVCDQATTMKLVAELLSWYAATPLPSQISNRYAQNHEFLVNEYYTDAILVQSAAGGNLCHMSVTNWCKASGFASESNECNERCARLTGDVAAKAVELLNAQHAGAFESKYPSPGEASGCMSCHKPGSDFDKGQWTRGKMDCNTCHVNPTISPHESTNFNVGILKNEKGQ